MTLNLPEFYETVEYQSRTGGTCDGTPAQDHLLVYLEHRNEQAKRA